LKGYKVAYKELVSYAIQGASQYADNRLKLFQEMAQTREQVMWEFSFMGQAQRFLVAYTPF
jgi:hypothetical protein